jgi:hypothetical protein
MRNGAKVFDCDISAWLRTGPSAWLRTGRLTANGREDTEIYYLSVALSVVEGPPACFHTV